MPTMDAIMIQDSNNWNYSLLKEEDTMNLKAPPPSPQDASMLETVFSKHLSAKIHAVVNPSSHEYRSHHAEALEKLLLAKRSHLPKRYTYHKRPSRIPVLSARIINKKKSKVKQYDALASAFERVHITTNPTKKENFRSNSNSNNKPSCFNGLVTMVMNKSKKNNCSLEETIIQDIKDMSL